MDFLITRYAKYIQFTQKLSFSSWRINFTLQIGPLGAERTKPLEGVVNLMYFQGSTC